MRTMKNLFIFSMIVAVFVSIIGGIVDVIIFNDGGKISPESKLWWNVFEITIVWIAIFLHHETVRQNKYWWIMLINTLLVWWIVHDVTIGIGLGMGPAHIGSGDFDQFFGRMCLQSGWLYIGVRLFLLLIGTLSYFSITKTK